MTATTGPGPPAGPPPAPPAGPPPGWVPPVAEPNAFARLRQRQPWLGPTLIGGLVAIGTAYTAWQDPNQGSGFFPGCPLKEATGLDCPGCGGTRALHALTHGDIGTALDHNVVLTIVMPLLVVAWGFWMVHALRATIARRRQGPPPTWPSALRVPRLSTRGWITVVAVLVGFAVVRNISAVPALDYLASEA